MQMRAVYVSQLGGPEVLDYREADMPAIGAKDVLIKVAAASVNFADIKARLGNYHGAGSPPFIPGLDCSGTVEAVGAEVTGLEIGQRVIAFPKTGAYAEYVASDEMLTFAIPDSLDFETAAASPIVSFTSYNLLTKVAQMQPEETVLIHAASGGIGTTAVQLAKLLGAKTVIGTVGTAAKESAALEAGADYVLNYRNEDLAEQVKELTGGKGVDVILDSLAGEIAEKSMQCLAPFGRLAHFGNAAGRAGTFRTNELHASCRSVLGYSFGTYRKYKPETVQYTAEKVIPYLADGRLKVMVGKRFPLLEAASAHRWIEDRKSTGKIILLPN